MGPVVAVTTWAIIGVLVTATPGGAQEQRSPCAVERDGAIAAQEPRNCAEHRLEHARGGDAGLADEKFPAALPDANGLRRQFALVDQDGDGRISRDEWLQWFGPAYAEVAKAMRRQPNAAD